jgi:hypothetical protein
MERPEKVRMDQRLVKVKNNGLSIPEGRRGRRMIERDIVTGKGAEEVTKTKAMKGMYLDRLRRMLARVDYPRTSIPQKHF